MCFTVSIFADTHQIETDLGAVFDEPGAYHPYFHVSGFTHPDLPFVTNEDPARVDELRWGLIPHWAKDAEKAHDIANKTLNARSEAMFEKPSFRDAAKKRRGLLPVSGFVEWRHEEDVKVPHLITFKGATIFTLGCLWGTWTDKESGEVHKTFSICTTDANELMSYVHNNKQRMPVVIPRADRKKWLESEDREEISHLTSPLQDGLLEARPLSREVSRVKVNDDRKELLEPVGDAKS